MQNVKADSQNHMNVRQSTQLNYQAVSIRREGMFSYKAALLLHDLLVLLLVTALVNLSHLGNHAIYGFFISGAILFFLFNLGLYSYHLIFSIRRHLLMTGQAFSYAFLTFTFAAGILFVPESILDPYLVPSTLVCAVAVITLSRKYKLDFLDLLYPVGLAFIIIGAVELFRKYAVLDNNIPWQAVTLTFFSTFAVLTITRMTLVHWVFNVLLRKRFRRQVLIVGGNGEANRFAKHIFERNAPFWIAGTVSARKDTNCALKEVPNKSCLGSLQDIPALADQNRIREIVVTSETISKRDLIDLLDFCTSAGITAWFSPRLMPIIDVKLNIDHFCGKPFIRLCSQKNSWFFYKLKYASDALITLPFFLIQLPFFLFLMALIKLDSKGPVFYVANAIGKHGIPFGMYKFRSMHVDSDKSIHQQYVTKYIRGEISEDEQKNGPIKIVKDPRVTRVGRILRKLSLDELPQLMNVLKGQMSLVGPRPCLPYEYDIYQDWHKKRTAVRPGITGLWQVTGRSEVLFEEMILLDLYYIYNNSLMLDLQILFETIFVVLEKKGAF